MDRKALKRQYKETPRPMGIYRVHNLVNGKSLVGASIDLPAIFNRIRAQLEMNLFINPGLQKDWNDLGEVGV